MAYRKAYYEANKDHLLEYARKWKKEKRRKDPKSADIDNKRVREYQQTPDGKAARKAGIINSTAKKRHQQGKVNKDDILILWKNYKCAECGEGNSPIEIDHIIPAMHGGHNVGANLQLLCIDCHKDKTKTELHIGCRQTSQELDQLMLFD
jgi:hypothetical protein